MKSGRAIGGSDYREGALERLVEANHLLRNELFAGSAYLAGRGAEAMMRAVIWHHDSEIKTGRKVLETGHDLSELLREVAKLGLLDGGRAEADLHMAVEYVSRLWFNNMRFVSNRKVTDIWMRLGEVHKRRPLKMAVGKFYEACVKIVRRCEVLL